jgi:hypothetical protein
MAVSGRTRKIYLSSSDKSTNTWIVGETSNSLDISRETFGGGAKEDEWDDFFAGRGSWTASASFNLDNSADKNQISLLNSLIAGTEVYLFIGTVTSGGTQTEGVWGKALVTSVSESNADGSVSSRDVSFQGCGAPTKVPAS